MRLKIVFITLSITSTCLSQSVKINELMYAPKDGEPEWIELYNATENSVNLKGWKIRDNNTNWYSLSAADCYVLPDSFLVLTKSDTIFSFHDIDSSKVLICTALPKFFLVNTGDTISIHDSMGSLVDSVFYDPSWGGSDGRSLERISADASPFLSTNWGSSLDSSGSTPGRRNSIAQCDYDLRVADFSAIISIIDSNVVFKINVKNCGLRATSPFDVDVFLDYDNDHVLQPNELAAEDDNVPGLKAGDSVQVVLGSTTKNSNVLDAFAIVKYSTDQDTTNNFSWERLKLLYPAKSLVVNEIMYAPQKPEPEWVELYNTSNNSINLNGFTLADNSGTEALITNKDYLLLPNDYAVVAHDSGIFSIHRGISDRILIAKIPSLNNTGDAVVIHDAAGNLIDSVNYSPSWGANTGGKSLERILPTGESNDPQNFETSMDSSGSTPAKINSVTPRNFDLAIATISYSPCPVQSGKTIIISATVMNRGLSISGSASVVLFCDRNGNGTCDAGEPTDSTRIPQMNRGDSTMVSFGSQKLFFGLYRFGIFINYPGDELQGNNTKLFLVNVGLPPASVILNEIMYAPKSPEQEWLELYNTSDSVIDLSNFKIETHGGSASIKTGSILPPGGFAVVCKDSSVSKFHFPVKNLITQPIPSLSNSGDWVTLSDNLGNLLDSVSYVPSYGGSSGKSLERIDCFAGNDSTNWHESVDSTGATPGIVNSVAVLPFDVSLKRLDCPKTLNVSQKGCLHLVIQNVGRNPLAGIGISVDVLSGIGEITAFSESRTLNTDLSPGDSASEDFVFTPSQPGRYRILAKILQQQDQRLWNDTLSTWIDVSYQPQSIVINEIMYSAGKMGEYFEIYNASQNDIDISFWTFHTSSTQSKSICNSAVPLLLSSGKYFVIAADSAILSFISDTSFVQILSSMPLRDSGGFIVVTDHSGSIVDSVYYQPSWHNNDIANTSGRSLEKINPTLPSNEKSSWSTCVSPDGGTPDRKNSLFVDAGNTTGSISVAPNPFSPDGDGIDDFTFISYTFPVSSVKVRLRIFDSIGRLIATPVDNSILPSTGRIVWDGRDGSGRIVNFGLYVLFIEVTGPDGRSLSTYKKPIVVAKRMR